MPPLPVEVALRSTSAKVTLDELKNAAQTCEQYVDDFLSHDWPVAVSSVSAYEPDQPVPPGAYPITIQDTLDDPGAAGYHLDDNNQPSALVEADGEWFFTVTHELAEMLVDPSGNHLYRAASPDPSAPANTPVMILLEVADPPEDPRFAITVNGVRCSDYILHNYAHGRQGPFSKSGGLTRQREVGPNGYISYVELKPDGSYGDWKQLTNFGAVQVSDLGAFSADLRAKHGSLRAWVDAVGPAREKSRQVLLGK